MSLLKTIILAAGSGTRMKSKTPKVLHKVLGKTMLEHVIFAAKEAGSDEICVVVGHQAEEVKHLVKEDVKFVMQEKQLGTGHAVMKAKDFIGKEGIILILFGDTPLITSKTLKKMIEFHKQKNNSVTVLSTIVEDPTGYGRIIRDESGAFVKSVEHKDTTEDEKKVREINSGMYCYNAEDLKESLKHITNYNTQGEYYLPDTLQILTEKGKKVNAMVAHDYKEILGVNNKVQLYNAMRIMQRRINYNLMEKGITIIDSNNTYISPDVIIDIDSVIYPGTIIEGKTEVGENCIIGPNSRIIDSKIQNEVTIESSTVLKSSIGTGTVVGPYAYIRPDSNIGKNVKIGDFVEIKNTCIGDNTKASHLTYIGDTDVGKNVNFGCGTVVVNYDGVKKHRTLIEDDAFIGCNTNLVSPVKVGRNAYTAAGSTITKEVPEDALGISRARQINKENWVKKSRKK